MVILLPFFVHTSIWFDVMIVIFLRLSSCSKCAQQFKIGFSFVNTRVFFLFVHCVVYLCTHDPYGMNENLAQFNSLTIAASVVALKSDRERLKLRLVLSLPTKSTSERNEWNQTEYTFGTFDWVSSSSPSSSDFFWMREGRWRFLRQEQDNQNVPTFIKNSIISKPFCFTFWLWLFKG